MKRKSRFLYLLTLRASLFLSITPLLFACSQHSLHPNAITIAISHDPMSLDPRSACLSKDISIAQALYEGLMREHNHHPQPALATHYTVSDDQTIYTFYLKPSQWSNGDPVTAYDFEESIKQLYQCEVAGSSVFLMGVIKNAQAITKHQLPVDALGIRAINDLTLEITLEQPIPHFLELISYPLFFPVHISLRNYYKTRGTPFPHISNGPFVLHTYHPQNQLIMKKNSRYHEHSAVQLETITFQVVPETHTAMQLLQKKLIDWMGSPWSAPITKEDQNRIPQEKLYKYPVLGTTALICNLNNTLIKNKSLRQALSYAIDKPSLLQFINSGQVAENFLPPSLSTLPIQGAMPQEQRESIAREYFKKAQQELSQKQLSELSIIYPLESASLNAIVQEIQQQIKHVLGISITIQGMEYHSFLDKRNRGDFSLATGKWVANYPRPSSFLAILGNPTPSVSTTSLTHWENPQYNTIVNRLHSHPNENDQYTAENLIKEDLPLIPLYHFEYVYAANPKIHQAYCSPLGHVDIKELVITK
ncbi:peptide ABC transporter substrate-binding protein [Chlamydia gallinacea]|uniref:Peptide-binding protein n=1 Tax=Chlamydia gallinacea 08-1274/3 TaxID=1143323 RepID=A0A173E080_9CHLA|nr:peptide ABC transporter substrate-binding protein [Chlamydia gallinacea]ANG66587.1 peptide-binding protein [Chlamydia gallinacea 08-1274/3]